MSLVGRATLCALLTVAFALAGCSSSDDGGNGGGNTTTKSTTGGKTTTGKTTTTTSSGPGGGGGGGGGGTGDNNPPQGSISASIKTGKAPISVNFTLKGSDQDGDDLTWNLDLNGDGKTDKSGDELPATASYNYTAAGSYNVSFAISDGTDTTTYRITINATAAAGGTGPQQIVDGSYIPLDSTTCFGGGLTGTPTNVAFEIDLATADGTFKATWDAQNPQLWLSVVFWIEGTAASSPAPNSGHGTFPPTPEPGVTEVTGNVGPVDTINATISSCGAPNADGKVNVHYEAWKGT